MIKKNILTGMDIQSTIKLLIIHFYLRGNQMSDIQNNSCDLLDQSNILDQQNLLLTISLQVVRCNIHFERIFEYILIDFVHTISMSMTL